MIICDLIGPQESLNIAFSTEHDVSYRVVWKLLINGNLTQAGAL